MSHSLKGSGPLTTEKFRINLPLPCNVNADVYILKGKTAGTAVDVDGLKLDGEDVGNYILIKNVGSGRHAFLR